MTETQSTSWRGVGRGGIEREKRASEVSVGREQGLFSVEVGTKIEMRSREWERERDAERKRGRAHGTGGGIEKGVYRYGLDLGPRPGLGRGFDK